MSTPVRPRPRRPAPGSIDRRDRVHATFTGLDRRRVAALLVALLVASTVWGIISRARSVAAHGQEITVVVATVPLVPGQEIGAADVTSLSWPADLSPAGAVDIDPVGRLVKYPMEPGEPVVTHRLHEIGADGSHGQRLVTLAQPPAAIGAERGTPVELYGVGLSQTTAGRLRALATGTIHAVDDRTVTVLVATTDVATVIGHAVFGAVEIVVIP